MSTAPKKPTKETIHKLSQTLLKAIEKNDPQGIFDIWNEGFPIARRGTVTTAPLHMAAAAGSTDVVKALVALEAEVNAIDEKGLTALHHALKNGHAETANLLLTVRADPNMVTHSGDSPLHLAVQHNVIDSLPYLLSESLTTDLTLKNMAGQTPFDLAVALGRGADVLGRLRAAGADQSAQARQAETVTPDQAVALLAQAVERGNAKEVLRWSKIGIDVKNIRAPGGLTLLHIAADGGNPDIVETLLSAGLDPREARDDGQTPIDLATAKEHHVVLGLLKSAPSAEKSATAVPSQETVEVATGMIVQAVMENDIANVQRALDKGLNIQNIRGPEGITLLHLAASRGNADMVKLLIDAGFDVTSETDNGALPIDLAVRGKHMGVASILHQALTMEEQRAALRYQQALANTADRTSAVNETTHVQVPPPPSEPVGQSGGAPRSPGEKRPAKRFADKEQWGTPADELHGFWQPGQSRIAARFRMHLAREKSGKTEPGNAPAATVKPAPIDVPITREQSAMKQAILHGDVKAIRAQVQGGYPIDDPVFAGSAALHVAAANGKTESIRALLAAGAHLNTPDQQGNTALLYAIGHQHPEAAILLSQTDGVDVDHRAPSGHTALHAAIQANLAVVVPYLLAQNPDLDVENSDGQTPLQFARALKRDDIVATLKSTPRSSPTTTTHAPVQRSTVAPSRVGEQSIAPPDNTDGNAPLSEEQMNRKIALVEAIQAGDLAKVQALAEAGESAIHYAVADGGPAVVRYLLSRGVNATAVLNMDGVTLTPLDIAIAIGDPDVIAILREALGEPATEEQGGDEEMGADGMMAAVNERRFKRVLAACESGDLNTATTVVAGEDDPILKMADAMGQTLLHAAVQGGNTDILDILIENGADLRASATLHLPTRPFDEGGPYLPLDLARVLHQDEAANVLAKACDAAKVDGETPHVIAMYGPDGAPYVKILNKYTKTEVHPGLAERMGMQIKQQMIGQRARG